MNNSCHPIEVSKVRKEVFVEGRRYALSLSRVVVPNGTKYFISVARDTESSINFEMIQDASQSWKVVPPAPEWVVRMKETIAEIIQGDDWFT